MPTLRPQGSPRLEVFDPQPAMSLVNPRMREFLLGGSLYPPNLGVLEEGRAPPPQPLAGTPAPCADPRALPSCPAGLAVARNTQGQKGLSGSFPSAKDMAGLRAELQGGYYAQSRDFSGAAAASPNTPLRRSEK